MSKKLRQCMNHLPIEAVCEYWATAISDAESPHPLSARDGKLLRPVRPHALRMTRVESARLLADTAVGHESTWRDELWRWAWGCRGF